MAPRRLTLLAGLILTAPLAHGSGFGFAALQGLISARHIRSIEELLPELPATLRYQYTLMFASRSLQDASFDIPRVILYGPDAQFILAFNGGPRQRGFHVLETMEFDYGTGQFLLREIEFPVQRDDAAAVTYSETNPDRCERCHGTPAGPVWETHPLWPGAYGERYHASLSVEEQAGMRRFLARQATDPRYRNLLGVERFANSETFRPSTQSSYSGTPPEPPNAALSVLLEPLVSWSIVVELSRNPHFDDYQYLLLGVSDGGCGGLDEFYPVEHWRAVRTDYANYVAAIKRESAREAAAKKLRLTPGNRHFSTSPVLHSAATLNMIRFVAESELHMPTGTWTLALEKGNDHSAAAPTALSSLRNALLAEVVGHDASIKALSEYATSADGDRYCRYLQRRSRTALEAEPLRLGLEGAAIISAGAAPADAIGPRTEQGAQLTPGDNYLPPPSALMICTECHASDVAPKIPFADPQLLRHELQSRLTSHGPLIDEIRYRLGPDAGSKKMPLGVDLSEAERVELESYFNQLAAQP